MQKMVKDIEEVTALTIKMGDLALSMLKESVETLDREDEDMVCRMKESRAVINKLEETIEAKAFRILMLYQPMAADMRRVAAILKMTTYFERIGKYGYNLAKYSVDIKGGKASAAFDGIKEMGKLAVGLVRGVMEAFKTRDISKLRTYGDTEDKLDALRKKVLTETIGFMKSNPERIDDGSMIIFASRYLERAGDYACKLAEKITYMVSGERIDCY